MSCNYLALEKSSIETKQLIGIWQAIVSKSSLFTRKPRPHASLNIHVDLISRNVQAKHLQGKYIGIDKQQLLKCGNFQLLTQKEATRYINLRQILARFFP